jgi:nicotinamide mononucleotide transporter
MPSFQDAFLWIGHNFIEIIAVISGLLYVVYTIRENILLWLFGIISSALYIWVFYNSGIYAYAILYVYYVIIGFYGWYNWGKISDDTLVRIRRTPRVLLVGCISVTFIIAVPIFYSLKRYTDTDMAAADSLLTSGGMVATWMLTQKYIEQWLFWIAIDIVSCGVMIYKGLYPSSVLFLIYGILAIKGYVEWKKTAKT